MRTFVKAGAAGAAAVMLAACGNGGGDNGGAGLATVNDAVRELGNVSTTVDLAQLSIISAPSAAAASPHSFGAMTAHRFGGAQQPRLAPAPHIATACPSGGSDDTAGMQTKSYAFNFFNTSATVNYRTHDYTACASTAQDGTVTTLDHFIEAGNTADGVMSYVLPGVAGTPLRQRTSFTSGGQTETTDLNLLATIQSSATQTSTDSRAVLQATLTATQTGSADYNGSFTLGSGGSNFYSVVTGDSSIAINGAYSYGSNVEGCGGGTLTVATPTALTLGQTSAGSSFPVDGVLAISLGNQIVNFTFNSDGSATLSGSVSGSLSASEVDSILQNGTGC